MLLLFFISSALIVHAIISSLLFFSITVLLHLEEVSAFPMLLYSCNHRISCGSEADTHVYPCCIPEEASLPGQIHQLILSHLSVSFYKVPLCCRLNRHIYQAVTFCCSIRILSWCKGLKFSLQFILQHIQSMCKWVNSC